MFRKRVWSRSYSVVFCQAEDGIRDLVRSRGLGDVYKRQAQAGIHRAPRFQRHADHGRADFPIERKRRRPIAGANYGCLLYTSDAADERSSVDLGGRRIIKKKKREEDGGRR